MAIVFNWKPEKRPSFIQLIKKGDVDGIVESVRLFFTTTRTAFDALGTVIEYKILDGKIHILKETKKSL